MGTKKREKIIKTSIIVKIKDKKSAYYNKIGEVVTKGNGDMWQVEVLYGLGIYFSENQLEIIETNPEICAMFKHKKMIYKSLNIN